MCFGNETGPSGRPPSDGREASVHRDSDRIYPDGGGKQINRLGRHRHHDRRVTEGVFLCSIGVYQAAKSLHSSRADLIREDIDANKLLELISVPFTFYLLDQLWSAWFFHMSANFLSYSFQRFLRRPYFWWAVRLLVFLG